MSNLTISQIESLITVKKDMLAKFIVALNPIAGDDDIANSKLLDLIEKCETSIDRLERTLEVRATAKNIRRLAA